MIAAASGQEREAPRERAALPTAPGPEPMRWFGGLPAVYRWARDPIGHTGRLFERYGSLVSVVRANARIMSAHPRS